MRELALKLVDGDREIRPTTPRETAKLRQIFDGAWRIFLRDGFDAASMNDIARAANVSKGTLYVYFASKEALFEGLIRDAREQQSERFLVLDDLPADLPSALRTIGVALTTMVLSPDHLAHLRTVIAVSAKLPQIGKTYYEAGPAHGAKRLAAFLERYVASGVLRPVDIEAAASTFINLCHGTLLKEGLFALEGAADPTRVATAVGDGVAVFLRAFGAGALRDYGLDPA